MFGMTPTTPSLTMQLTSGVDVFAHVGGQKTDTLSNYCDNIEAYDKIDFSFLSNVTIFRLFLEITTNSNFELSPVRQHTEGVAGSIICILLEIYFSFSS